MSEPVTLIIAIFGAIITWTTTVVAMVLWLNGKFQYLEKTIYREMEKHRREDDAQFRAIGTRIQRMELKVFGFTHVGDLNSPAE